MTARQSLQPLEDDQRYAELLGRLEESGPALRPVVLPDAPSARAELRRLGLDEVDVEEAVAALAELEQSPVLRWVLERSLSRLAQTRGCADASFGPLPQLPAELGSAGRCLPIHLFMIAAPDVRAWHRERGVPAPVTEATLADLGRHVRIHRRMYETTGVDAPGWMMLHLRGLLFECGRLQYEPIRLRLPPGDHDGAHPAAGGGPAAGEDVMSVHIPESGALAASAVDASLLEGRRLFELCFPDPPRRYFTCSSWLLDDQLAEHLPPTSNIIRFQRRFRLLPGGREADADVLTFVFRRPDPVLSELPQETTLQRAVVAHLRAGRHWRARTGWLER